MELRHKSVHALSVDKEANMRGICEVVEHHLWSSDSRGVEGDKLLTEESEVKICWPGYFEWLHQADPPSVELDVRDVTIPFADSPINCEPPPFKETQAVVNQLKGDKAPRICDRIWKCCTCVTACSSVLCLEHRYHPN